MYGSWGTLVIVTGCPPAVARSGLQCGVAKLTAIGGWMAQERVVGRVPQVG